MVFQFKSIAMVNYIYEIDVAHPPRRPEIVEKMLLEALLLVRNHAHLRVIKVIHGYGSSGQGGQTKETVRNWAYVNRKQLVDTIDGEHYSIFDAKTQSLRNECGQLFDPDLENSNPGVTLLWIR